MTGTRAILCRLFGAALVAGTATVAVPAFSHAAGTVGTTTTMTITSSANPAGFGELVILNATVIPAAGTGVPTGSVSFTDAGTSLADVALDGNGQAALSESALVVGPHAVVAQYSGDSVFAGSSSPTLQQVITTQGSTSTIFSTLSPAVYGQQVILVITVMANQGSAVPSGNVTLLDGSTLITTAALDATGTAVAVTSTLGAGDHVITANYLGNAGFAGSSTSLGETITPAATTLGLAPSSNPSVLGQPVTFTATVIPASGTGPSGTISFSDAGVAIGGAPLDTGGVARLTLANLPAGGHTIAAVYAGDANFTGSTSATVHQQVDRVATDTSLASSANPAAFATALTLSAAVSGVGGTPTGTVSFTDGGAALGGAALDATGHASITVAALGVGTHIIEASYGGDAGFAPSIALPLSETINVAASQLAVSASANPSSYGSPLNLTAVLTTNHVGAAGVVTFTDGAATLGTASLNSSGQASLIVNSLAVGSHSIGASYAGDATTAPSTAGPITEVVVAATSGTVISSSRSPSPAGDSVTFTATVTAAAATPTGSVIFSDGTATLGTVDVDARGHASLVASGLSPGSHTIMATYSGDAHLSGSAASVIQLVELVPTATSLSSSNNPAMATTAVTLTAGVTSSSGTPDGSVTFSDGGVRLGAAVVDATGRATLTVAPLSLGTHHISATYSGGGRRFADSSSATLDEAVTLIVTSTTLTAAANPITVGAPAVFTAVVTGATGATPPGSVSFADGTAVLGDVPLDGHGAASLTASALSPGTHRLTATYTPVDPFAASSSAALDETVLRVASAVSLSSSPNPSAAGALVTLSSTVTATAGGNPTGDVSFLDGSTVIGLVTLHAGSATLTTAALGAGAHALSAVYGGDLNHAPATSALLHQTVTQAATSTGLAVSPNPAQTGQVVSLRATVTSPGGHATGSVTFLDGTTAIGTAVIGTGGVATLTTSTLGVGSHSLTATYAGQGNDGPSRSSTIVLRVQQGGGDGCDAHSGDHADGSGQTGQQRQASADKQGPNDCKGDGDGDDKDSSENAKDHDSHDGGAVATKPSATPPAPAAGKAG